MAGPATVNPKLGIALWLLLLVTLVLLMWLLPEFNPPR